MSPLFAESGNTTVNLEVEDEAAPVVTPPGGTVHVEDTMPPKIQNVAITEITTSSAAISWDTAEPAFCWLPWGRTKNYGAGTSSEDTFYEEHLMKLTKLLPATDYHFKIYCKDKNQNATSTDAHQFTTTALPDTTPPANVSDFEAIAGDKKLTLKWQNPPDSDFKEVRIVRSTVFYPTDPWEGTLVYVGREEFVEDIELTNGITYYYTAFSYDEVGNYSSGAIIQAIPQEPGVPPPPPPPPVTPPVVPPPPEVEALTLEDFDFWQEGRKLPIMQGKIPLNEALPLTVSIDYEKVPEVLKTIMLTLEKDNKYFSFLLRINQDKTRYLATLVPPEPRSYPMTVYVLDYKNQALKAIKGTLEIKEIERPAISPEELGPESSFKRLLSRVTRNARLLLYIFSAIVIGLILLKITLHIKRKREQRKVEKQQYY